MRKEQVLEIIEASTSLVDEFEKTITLMREKTNEDGVGFDTGRTITNTDSSFNDIYSRFLSAQEIISKFDTASNYNLVPSQRLRTLKQSIDELLKDVEAIYNLFNERLRSKTDWLSFNYENFHLQTGDGNQHNFAGSFQNMHNHCETFLENYYQVLVVLRPSKANYSFLAASNALQRLLDTHNEKLEILNEQLSDANAQIESTSSLYDSTEQKSSEISDHLKHSEANSLKIEELNGDAESQLEEITNVHSNATQLKNSVAEYNDQFTEFDTQLEQRTATFNSGTQSIETLIKKFTEFESTVATTIQQSEEMLKGATVSGLAGRFEELRKELTIELEASKGAFTWGIVALFISAIPLILFLFLPLLGALLKSSHPEFAEAALTYGPNNGITGWQYVGQILARFVILIPAAWYIRFNAIRHASLFRLREHYAYKYSMAVSVEGFKKQAPGYEAEIAATVLSQLAFNPADKLLSSKQVEERNAPNPVFEYLLSKLRSNNDGKKDL